MTKIHAKVDLHNDNFIGIEVHSMAIDMFYPTWHGELKHIGRVYDHKRRFKNSECLQDTTCRKENKLDEAVWAMQPKADFEIMDTVYATVEAQGMAQTIFSLVWNLIKSGGHLMIPTTGVMQVKASSATPVTMSMICDNSLNVFTLILESVECALNSIDVGWVEMDDAINNLQVDVLSYLKPNENGTIMESHKPRGAAKGYERVLKKLNLAGLAA